VEKQFVKKERISMDKHPSISAHTFSDVLIVPKKSDLSSRNKVCLSTDFTLFKMELPIFSANMKTVTGTQMAIAMAENGGMGILHRFCSVDQAVSDFREVQSYFRDDKEVTNSLLIDESIGGIKGTIETINGEIGEGIQIHGQSIDGTLPPCRTDSQFAVSLNCTQKDSCICNVDHQYAAGVSIGVQEDDKKRFDNLYDAGARIFCIDIAHGHCTLMEKILKWISGKNLKNILIIAGNIATGDGAYDLCDWGADIVKVGTGPGSACLTRKNAGVGVPQLYALESVSEEFEKQGIKNKKIICDGGMSSSGDIAKALKYADAVMLGGMLAGTTETPGNVFTDENGRFYKVYAGSASGENKTSNGGVNEFVEGVSKTIEFRGHAKHILRQIKHGLQSSFSYVGAHNLSDFQEKCEFINISDGGRTESKL
jgi:IMP dehydrogenase